MVKYIFKDVFQANRRICSKMPDVQFYSPALGGAIYTAHYATGVTKYQQITLLTPGQFFFCCHSHSYIVS